MPEEKSKFECYAKLGASLYAQSSADHEKFGTLLGIVYDTPKGEEVMNAVAFKGYKFMYETMFNVNGACDYEHKVVRLDSYHRQMELAPILVHECTHIMQVDRLCENKKNPVAAEVIDRVDAAAFIKLNRAFEADACAHQAAAAYQMKETYPGVYEKEMKTPMMQAYVAEMDKSGNETKAMQASFKAWYGYKNYQESYEKMHVSKIRLNTERNKKDFNISRHPVELSNKDIAAVCLLNGKPYIEASFFSSQEALEVSEHGKRELLATGDRSVLKLPVRQNKKETSLAPAVLKNAVAGKIARG